MPDTKSEDGPGNVNLETHPLVAKLHADPDELTELVALVGYLGPSKRTDYVRLYVDLTFRNYYEIPNAGIVSTSPTDASDENSPTTVHVAGDTQVDKVSITSQSTEARFLQGSIASSYLGTAGGGAQADVAGWPASPTCWCMSHTCAQGAAQGAAQAGQPYTDTLFATCVCTYENCGQAGVQGHVAPWPVTGACHNTQWQACTQNCGQAGAQAGAQFWPASPTCWCVTARNCHQGAAQAAQPYTDTLFHSCACTYENCGQAGGRAGAQFWPASPTCWCFRTVQGCT